jgi:phage terminase large subunit GpA-like protein
MVSDVEPVFAATPALRGALTIDTDEGDRNTLLSKRFPGGSLKIVAAKAPRNLRRHTARVLIVDEAAIVAWRNAERIYLSLCVARRETIP